MKYLVIILLATCATYAAEVQVIVTSDTATELVNTTITTNNEVLQALENWRLQHTDEYPDRAAFFRKILINAAKRVLKASPTAAMQTERDTANTAIEAEETLINDSFVEP